MRPWALAGFSGSGKSTVARLLAGLTGRRCADLDDLIGRERVLSLLDEGEHALRAAEAEALARLAEGPPGVVVALGGGVLEGAASRRLLERAFVVAWLDAPPQACLARCAAEPERRRPILEAAAAEGPAAVARLHARRTRAARHAMLRVDATLPADEVARILLPRLHASESGS